MTNIFQGNNDKLINIDSNLRADKLNGKKVKVGNQSISVSKILFLESKLKNTDTFTRY